MLATVERLSVANVIAKALALTPSQPGSLNKAVELGVPSFLTGDAIWDWAGNKFPGASWMDICKTLMSTNRADVSSSHPVVELAAICFPQQAHLIGPAVDMIQEDPTLVRGQLEAWVKDPAKIQAGVTNLLKAPDQLIRCKACYQPFYTDGSRGCPFCSE